MFRKIRTHQVFRLKQKSDESVDYFAGKKKRNCKKFSQNKHSKTIFNLTTTKTSSLNHANRRRQQKV